MNSPIPGITLMSSGEKRIKRKSSQIAAQIARQDIDAVRNDGLIIYCSLTPKDEIELRVVSGPPEIVCANRCPGGTGVRVESPHEATRVYAPAAGQTSSSWAALLAPPARRLSPSNAMPKITKTIRKPTALITDRVYPRARTSINGYG